MKAKEKWLLTVCQRRVRCLRLACAAALILSANSATTQPSNFSEESIRPLQADAQQLERRAARLAAKWREEVKLELIRSRNRLEADAEDWLAGIEFSGAEFQTRFDEALLVGQSMGLDPDKMRRYLDLLKRSIRRADLREFETRYAEDVPETSVEAAIDWLEIGTEDADNASAERQAFRAALYRRTSLLFFEALLERDAQKVVAKLSQIQQAIQSIQGADALRLQAETESLIATQTLISDVASGFPVVGETLDFLSLTSGETPSGEALDGWGKAFALIGLVPVAGDLIQIARRAPATINTMAGIVVGLENASPQNIQAISNATGASPSTINDVITKLRQVPEVSASTAKLGTRSMRNHSNQAIIASFNDPSVRAADELWRAAKKEAEGHVDQLRQTLREQSDTLDSKVIQDYIAVRSNNLAVKTLQNADYSTRAQVSAVEKKLFGSFVKNDTGAVVNAGDGLVDRATFSSMASELEPALTIAIKADNTVEAIGRLKRDMGSTVENEIASPAAFMEVNAKLSRLEKDLSTAQQALRNEPGGAAAIRIVRTVKRRKNSEGNGLYIGDSLAADELSIEVFNATNEIPAAGKIGTDRDATFRLVDGDGKRIDIPAEFAAKHYAISLYETLHPGQLLNRADPSDVEKALAFSRQMDHAITDSVDAEAYKQYTAELSDILGSEARNNPAVLSKVDVESLQRTFEFKGFHLLEPVPGNPKQTLINRVEAMRQIRKQFDNLVLPRATREGNALEEVIPAKTLVSYQLLQRVETGDITPAQAESGLKAIGLTLEQTIVLIADSINRVGGRAE